MSDEIFDLIAPTDFFSGMAPDEVRVLAGFGHIEDTDAGDYLIERGDPASGFRLITIGRVAIELATHARPHMIQTLGPGDVLGISWMIPPHTWQFSARALTPTRAVYLDTDRIREEADRDLLLHDDLVTRFLVVMAKRLQATRLRLLDVYQKADA